MEWESKEIEENISLLIELAKNCVPITLGSLLNTFEDMKRDYYTSYTERKYDGVSTTKENKRILEIKVRRITPNRYGNDVMRIIKLKAYIKLLLKINPNASIDYLDLSDYLTIGCLDLLFALDKLYDTRIG